MNKKKLLIGLVSIVIILALGLLVFYNISLGAVSSEEDNVTFIVNEGSGKRKIVEDLSDAGIIKSANAALAYLFLNRDIVLLAGEYTIDKSDDVKSIFNLLSVGEVEATMSVTFVEGKRITDYASVISEKFGFSYDEVISKFEDREYAESLISKYPILTKEILNEDIFYPLEGYLFPDTYEFYVSASLESIIEKLISNMNYKINQELSNVSDSSYSIHEIITMASITEIEANSSSDRQKVAQVIYKRLNTNMTLGMDVTTYYGVQKSLTEELTTLDLNANNGYNTRALNFTGLPVGAICNPSFGSISAVLNPASTNFLYFYADILTGEVFFQETYDEFLEVKNRY